MADDRIVHVIDDDDAVRDSLSFLLKSAGISVRTYGSAGAFLSALPSITATCVITDIRMPDIDGITLLRRLRESGNTVPVIVITGHGDVPMAVEAMKLGAADFFEKPFDDESLLATVRTILDRDDDRARTTALQAEIRQRMTSLSEREHQVLDGLVAGKPNKIIAHELGISPRTVEIYRANVMTKMQAGSLSELVRMAIVSGGLPE